MEKAFPGQERDGYIGQNPIGTCIDTRIDGIFVKVRVAFLTRESFARLVFCAEKSAYTIY